MAGLGDLEADFVEVETEGNSEHINLDAGQAKLPPRWRQIEMAREKTQLSKILDSYDEWELDDSEE
jgi:hypothetical protein